MSRIIVDPTNINPNLGECSSLWGWAYTDNQGVCHTQSYEGEPDPRLSQTGGIKCPTGLIMGTDGMCHVPFVNPAPQQTTPTGAGTIIEKAQAFARQNPLILYGGLALIGYMIFKDK